MVDFSDRRLPVGLIVLPICALMVLCAFNCGATTGESGKFHVNIGFSSKAFVNVPRKDIRVAVRMLSQKVARKTVGSANSQIYDSIADIEQDLKAKKLDAVALTPEDFIELSSHIPLDPVMVTETDRGREVSLLLLTRKDSRIRTVRDLKSRTIAIPAKIVQYGNMYFTWVETLIMREGFQRIEAFFSTVNEAPSPSQALMQVFFHQADACVVTDQILDLASELNPQIGKELVILARVDKLAGGIIVFRHDLPEDRKQKLRQALLTLHEDQEGKQLFVLFHLNRLVPFRPEYMRATKAFFAEHRELRHRIAQKH